jgi:hypothetical protein
LWVGLSMFASQRTSRNQLMIIVEDTVAYITGMT